MKSTFLILLFSLVAFAGFSQERTPRVNAREDAQRARIYQGRRSGEITRREAMALNMEQRHIRRSERRMKANGDVSVNERRRLEREQDRANRHIRRIKHNDVSRQD